MFCSFFWGGGGGGRGAAGDNKSVATKPAWCRTEWICRPAYPEIQSGIHGQQKTDFSDNVNDGTNGTIVILEWIQCKHSRTSQQSISQYLSKLVEVMKWIFRSSADRTSQDHQDGC